MNRVKYIGGEFCSKDMDSFLDEVGDYDLFFQKSEERRFFETGIDSMAYIISSIGVENIKLWVPENFCQASLNRLSKKMNEIELEMKFYIDLSDLTEKVNNDDVVLFVHRNGLDLEGQKKLGEINARFYLLEDFVQAPLDLSKYQGYGAFNSLRKFLPLEVSVCYSPESTCMVENNTSPYYSMKKKAVALKDEFYSNKDENLEDKYLSMYKNAEELLTVSEQITKVRSEELGKMKKVAFGRILEARRKNYERLKNGILSIGQITIFRGDYMYLMIETKDRDKLRKFCFENGVFPAVHWLDAKTKLSEKTMSFHVDQRYDEQDMDVVVNLVNDFKFKFWS